MSKLVAFNRKHETLYLKTAKAKLYCNTRWESTTDSASFFLDWEDVTIAFAEEHGKSSEMSPSVFWKVNIIVAMLMEPINKCFKQCQGIKVSTSKQRSYVNDVVNYFELRT